MMISNQTGWGNDNYKMEKTLQNYDFSNWAPAVCTGTGGTGADAGESGNSFHSHSLAFGSKKNSLAGQY